MYMYSEPSIKQLFFVVCDIFNYIKGTLSDWSGAGLSARLAWQL